MKTINIALVAALLIASVAAIHAQTLPKTLTVKGEEYTGVFYKGRDELRVKFTHDAGFATVLISDLPPDLQKDFPVDSTKAAQQLQDDAKKQNELARVQAIAANKAAQDQAAAANQAAQAAQEVGMWEPFESCVKNGRAWRPWTVEQTRNLLDQIKINCKRRLDNGKATPAVVANWCKLVWNHQIVEGMPSSLVLMAMNAKPSRTHEDSRGNMVWTYEILNEKERGTLVIQIRDGDVESFSKSMY